MLEVRVVPVQSKSIIEYFTLTVVLNSDWNERRRTIKYGVLPEQEAVVGIMISKVLLNPSSLQAAMRIEEISEFVPTLSIAVSHAEDQ